MAVDILGYCSLPWGPRTKKTSTKKTRHLPYPTGRIFLFAPFGQGTLPHYRGSTLAVASVPSICASSVRWRSYQTRRPSTSLAPTASTTSPWSRPQRLPPCRLGRVEGVGDPGARGPHRGAFGSLRATAGSESVLIQGATVTHRECVNNINSVEVKATYARRQAARES